MNKKLSLMTLAVLSLMAFNTVHAQELDSDADRISDSQERETGTNPFVADIPSFTGKFFKSLKVIHKFKNANGDKQNDYLVGPQGTIEKSEGHFYSALAAQGRLNGNSKKLKFRKNPNIYTSAVLSESLGHKIGVETSELLGNGYELDEVGFEIKNTIKFDSIYPSIKALIYTIYIQDGDGLIKIGTYADPATYLAGEEKEVTYNIKVKNKELKEKLKNMPGRFIVLELSNYEIPELDTTYDELLEELDIKTQTLTIAGDTVETKHVVVNPDGDFEQFFSTWASGYNFADAGKWKVYSTSGRNVMDPSYGMGLDHYFVDTKNASDVLKVGIPTSLKIPGAVSNFYIPKKPLKDFSFRISGLVANIPGQNHSTAQEALCNPDRGAQLIGNAVNVSYFGVRNDVVSLIALDANFNTFTAYQNIKVGDRMFNLRDLILNSDLTVATEQNQYVFRATPKFLNVLSDMSARGLDFSLSSGTAPVMIANGKRIDSCYCNYRIDIPEPREHDTHNGGDTGGGNHLWSGVGASKSVKTLASVLAAKKHRDEQRGCNAVNASNPVASAYQTSYKFDVTFFPYN